ncbi:MAG: PilZ domain-containing protein [Planctomycetes bacterium]|nr:PilZ domain-containing protein [Planctomycetota bacterium]
MSATVPAGYAPVTVVRREVDRFLEAARKRSEQDGHHRRRARRRHHRSWPLLVSLTGRPFDADISAALHNASDLGIGFLSPVNVVPGATVYLKLFCYDDFCPRVPAKVRHVTHTRHGFLVGCEFDLADETACHRAVELGRHSRKCRAED